MWVADNKHIGVKRNLQLRIKQKWAKDGTLNNMHIPEKEEESTD